MLNPKQFEKYLWPAVDFLFKHMKEHDKICNFFVQGTSERLWDYFQEVPKRHFVFQIEDDDIFKMKKALGNKICLCGGMPTFLLGHGNPGECVEYAKRLVNEIGYDGAYMLCSNKLLSFPHDAKRENLIAINDYLVKERL